MDAFLQDFSAYRLDEILGDWKPYAEVLRNAVERTCRKHGIAFAEAEAAAHLRRGAELGAARRTCRSR